MNRPINFFSHPLVGILGSLASLIGLGLAVYFYYESVRSPGLTYHVHPVRATVVKAADAGGLRVSFGGKDVQGDINAVQIAIWNAGKQPILAADILASITLQSDPTIPLLEATIRKTSRDVTQVTLDRSQLSAGRLGITWKILEQGDGCVIQLIYSGSVDHRFALVGNIVGQRSVTELKYTGSISSPSEQYFKQSQRARISGWTSIAVGIVTAAFSISRIRRRRRRRRHRALPDDEKDIFFYLPTFVTFLYIGLGCYQLYQSILPGPPFGF